jgi:hypothetical protein
MESTQLKIDDKKGEERDSRNMGERRLRKRRHYIVDFVRTNFFRFSVGLAGVTPEIERREHHYRTSYSRNSCSDDF